jgi:hypothetical protein
MIQKFSFFSFFRNLKGQAGMSMAEMGITMGLVGLGALGAASLSGNMQTGSRKIQGMVAVNTFASSLNSYLYSSLGCEDLKQVGALSDQPKEIKLSLWNYQGITLFQGGYDSANKKLTPTINFDIASLTAYYETDPTPAQVKDSTDQLLTKSILKLKAVLKVGKKPLEYVYNVPVLVSPSNVVAYCSDEKNLAETCAAAQGKYNAATKECELGNSCKIKDTWNQLWCDKPPCSPIFGASKTNQYTGGFSCPSGSTQTISQVEQWISQRKCGKKCTEDIHNKMTWAICLECPP